LRLAHFDLLRLTAAQTLDFLRQDVDAPAKVLNLIALCGGSGGIGWRTGLCWRRWLLGRCGDGKIHGEKERDERRSTEHSNASSGSIET
jgi:hypothetical protein